MASKTSMTTYNKTGYAKSSGVSDLKAELQNYQTDDASVRQEAVEQYKPTYDAEKQSLKTQMSALINAQTNDSTLLNKQYDQSISSMMAQLHKRGLDKGGLPQAQTDALERFRNEVKEQRQAIYGVQRQGVQNNYDTLKKNYDANVTRRMYDIKAHNLQMTTKLLETVADLQSNSYQSYIDYLLAKKARRSYGGGGGGGYYSGNSSTPPGSSAPDTTLEDYFNENKGNKTTNKESLGIKKGAKDKQYASLRVTKIPDFIMDKLK